MAEPTSGCWSCTWHRRSFTPAQSSSGLRGQVRRNLYPHRASSHSRDLPCPVPRDGHAAWKGSSGALRASCLSPSVTALATDGSSSALGTQARRAQQKRAAPHCSHSPALLGSRGRGAAGGAALLQPRAQYLPGKPRERVGRKVQEGPGKLPPCARSGERCVSGGRVSKACSERLSPFNTFAFVIYGEDDVVRF